MATIIINPNILGDNNPWTTVNKTADESRINNLTTSNDADLFFPVEANSIYEFELHIICTGTPLVGGIRMSLGLPANSFANWDFRSSSSSAIGNGTNASVVNSVIAALSMVSTQVIFASGQVYVGSTAGVVNVQWAQNALSLSPVTFKGGTPPSKLLWKKLP